MKNEIGRKITSLTLMTIMLAGGMTIAFPGFTPDAYAVNANLIVSAENTGGYVSGAQVVEIVVIDDDLDATASPDVTVNGDAVAMIRTNDGNWYAYIADNSAVKDVQAEGTPGVSFGGVIDAGIDGSNAVETYGGGADDTAQNVVKSEKTVADNANWPFIQTYAFPSTIEIQYNKAGGTQISTLQFDDNAPGLSLDRSIYPSGAQVHVTIEDHRLNIDPTSDDIWAWNVESGTMYYMLDASNDARVIPNDGTLTAALAADDNAVDGFAATSVCADCILLIEPNRQNDNLVDDVVLELVSLKDLPIRATAEMIPEVADDPDTGDDETAPAVPAEMWFTVAEDGGPNTAVFTATDLSDNSILRIADDAIRGSSATIDYDDSITGIQVQFSEATIQIQSPDDVWTSGLAIPIVVVDGDVNKNSLADDDLAVSDPNSIIPTLVTGDPFTLGEVSSNLVTWVGWSVGDENAEFIRLLATASPDPTLDATLNYTINGDNPFTLKGFASTTDDGVVTYADEDGDTVPNAVVLQQAAEVELFSDRAIL